MKDNKGNIIAKKDGISKITIKHKTQKLIKSIVIKVEAKKKEEVKENNLYFLKTTSGNIYCLNDLDKIKNEYYESFEEL